MRVYLLNFLIICSVLILTTGDAMAKSENRLDKILEQHIEAMGGRQRLSEINSFIGYGVVNLGGLRGASLQYFKAPDKLANQADFGLIKRHDGFDGQIAWLTDEQGQNPDTASSLIPSKIAQIYKITYSYADIGGIPGAVSDRGDTTIGGSVYHKIALQPEGGDSSIVYINSTTHLIEYQLNVHDGITVWTAFDNFVEIDGIVVAMKGTTTSTDAPLIISMELDSIFVNRDIPDSVFSIGSERVSMISFPETSDSVDVPFVFYNGSIIIKASINDRKPLNFLLDTGASLTTLNKSFADRYGIQTEGKAPIRGFGGFSSIEYGEVNSFHLGQITWHVKSLPVMELDNLAMAKGIQLGGILGSDFFKEMGIRIDFSTRVITLFADSLSSLPSNTDPIAFTIENYIPVIEATINGQSVRLGIDLGAGPGLVLNAASEAVAVLQLEFEEYGDHSVTGIAGRQTMSVANIASLSLGTIEINDIKSRILAPNGPLRFPGAFDGLLGVGIMNNYLVYMDYPNRRFFIVEQ